MDSYIIKPLNYEQLTEEAPYIIQFIYVLGITYEPIFDKLFQYAMQNHHEYFIVNN